MSAPDDAERWARAALARLAEPGNRTLGDVLACDGPVATLEAVISGDLPDGELLAQLQARLPSLDVDADVRALAAVDGRLVCPGDDEWPEQVNDLGTAAPIALWVRGGAHLASAVERAVAVVGTRTPTDYGEHVATGLAADLAERDWTVVSGGAYGIDAAAHRGALAMSGTTVAVLACGVDVPYPRAHHQLFAGILDEGALVSELPPGCAPHRVRFLTRNRLIAGLAAGTVVVEAASRSGTRRTASDTRDLGRPLMVVPGPVTSATSVGCHALLRDDAPAVLVTGVADVLEMVGRIGADLAPVPRGEVRPRDRLSAEAARVLEAVPLRRAQGPARIASTAGLPLAVVESALGLLLLEGFVQARPDGWRLAPDASELRRSGETADSDTPGQAGGA